MRRTSMTLLLVSIAACGHDDSSSDAILQDNASDEAFLNILDADAQGETMADDARSAHLTAPADAAALPGGTPATFSWTLPATARHGVGSGLFVWMRLSGGGLVAPIDVVSIGSTSWTPPAGSWEEIAAATGAVTVRLVTARVEDTIVTEGPFRPTEDTTFTVTQ